MGGKRKLSWFYKVKEDNSVGGNYIWRNKQ